MKPLCSKTHSALLVLALLKNTAYPFGLTYATTNYPANDNNKGKVAQLCSRNGLLVATLSTSPTVSTTAHSMIKTLPASEGVVDVTCNDVNATSINKSYHQQSEAPSSYQSNGQKLMPNTIGRNGASGEYNASLLSKFIYSYVSPLVSTVQQRPLDINDAFTIPADKSMDSMVPKLEQRYSEERSNALAAVKTAGRENLNWVRQINQSIKRTKKKQTSTNRNDEDYSISESLVLGKALLKHQKSLFIKTGFLRLFNTLIQAFPALLVARLLRLIEANSTPKTSISAAAALIAVLSVKMIIENQYFHHVLKYATQIRGVAAGIIFDKSLKLASDENAVGVGSMLNLMQTDASVLENTALQLHTLWDGPLQIAIYTTLLYRYLGKSVLYGMTVLLLTIPVNILLLRVLNTMTRYENKAKDARTKRTTETISSIKLLKLQGWESFFAADIEREREEELSRHVTRGAVRALNQAISNAVPAIVLVVTLMAYSRSGAPIVASTIFTAISLFNQLRFPLFFFPMLIDSVANGRNSLKRIATYLAQEEIKPYLQRLPIVPGEGACISMTNGNFLWSSQGKPALCGANLSVRTGEIVAIVGPVGSGKSALVKSLLGELHPDPRATLDSSSETSRYGPPLVTVKGKVAYCNQEAWVPSGTIREAVVFGREYNETKYLAAVRDAGLDTDIVDVFDSSKGSAIQGILTHDTDVGEGGSSLSGGQRARVALARALYDDEAVVFLLDDVLSALDASVGSIVFDRLVSRLKQTRSAAILVTNSPSFPTRCDKVVLIDVVDGCSRILDVGTYKELIARGHDLRNISTNNLRYNQEEEKVRVMVNTIFDESRPITADGNNTISFVLETTSCNVDTSCHADPDGQKDLECDPNFNELIFLGTSSSEDYLKPTTIDRPEVKTEKTATQLKILSPDETMSTKSVPVSAYLSYLRSVKSPLLVIGTVLSYLMVNGAQFYQQFIVAKWTEVGRAQAMSVALQGRYLTSLAQAAFVVSAFLWIRSFFLVKVGVKASRRLHKQMLRSVIQAPMSFFDATPSGQLISRFGRELDTVDRGLPDGIGAVLFCFLQIFTSAAALAGVVTPGMLVPLVSVGFLYLKTTSRFRPAARDLKRAETKSRSPIYTHFREAIRGTEVIRSISNGVRMWSSRHRHLTDQNLSVYYTVKSLDRWLSIRLENLGNLVVFMGAIASIFLSNNGRMKAGAAGWGLTQSLAITGLLTWAVRCLTDLESQMLSLIRIQEITDLESTEGDLSEPEVDQTINKNDMAVTQVNKMPREFDGPGEALRSLPEARSFQMASCPAQSHALILSGWPWEGRVQLKNTSMRYNTFSPLVLRNITLDVKPGTTFAMVGRSGSGKSSVLLTLFRLAEIEEGGIYIDGVDIRSVALKTLRASLSIIPQDPSLFAGTLMFNLDATGSASHDDAWAALEAASPDLARFFAGEKGLDTVIAEGGRNLSVGQRQLVCLARALLRKDKILILDEATSSIDFKTDAQVQATIRKEFVNKGVTVITVAHRLDTVFGYDRIAVMGNGRVLEYGAPQDLLLKRNGNFRKLVIDMNQQEKKSSGFLVEAY